MAAQFLVEKDSRGRLALGSVLTSERYLVTCDSHGRVVLEPAVVLTATEERLLADSVFRSEMTAAAFEPAQPLELDTL